MLVQQTHDRKENIERMHEQLLAMQKAFKNRIEGKNDDAQPSSPEQVKVRTSNSVYRLGRSASKTKQTSREAYTNKRALIHARAHTHTHTHTHTQPHRKRRSQHSRPSPHLQVWALQRSHRR